MKLADAQRLAARADPTIRVDAVRALAGGEIIFADDSKELIPKSSHRQ